MLKCKYHTVATVVDILAEESVNWIAERIGPTIHMESMIEVMNTSAEILPEIYICQPIGNTVIRVQGAIV